jgi:hypothetical protein
MKGKKISRDWNWQDFISFSSMLMIIYLVILKAYALGTDKSQAYQKNRNMFVLFFSEALV